MTVLSAGSNPVSMPYPCAHPPMEVLQGMKVPLCFGRKIAACAWELGQCRQHTKAKPWAKTLQGQAGKPEASSEASIQLRGATLDPKVHVQPTSRAYILFLDLALCQNHRVQCLHGLQRKDTKCDLAQTVMTIYY